MGERVDIAKVEEKVDDYLHEQAFMVSSLEVKATPS